MQTNGQHIEQFPYLGLFLGKLSFICTKQDYIKTHVHQHK